MSFRYALPLVCLTAVVFGQPAPQVQVMPYDSSMEDRVSADGYVDVEENEYPATFADKASGITVYWGFDDSLMYAALETKGAGWLAIGFGSPNMNEANIIIGFYSDDSAEVYNQVGVNFTHAAPAEGDSALADWDYDIDRDDETGITTMEFSYPLKFPALTGLAIPGLEPGDTYDMILAQNTKTISLNAKHTNRSALKLKMEENPHRTKKEAGPAGGK
jgi:hypothetical protein